MIVVKPKMATHYRIRGGDEIVPVQELALLDYFTRNMNGLDALPGLFIGCEVVDPKSLRKRGVTLWVDDESGRCHAARAARSRTTTSAGAATQGVAGVGSASVGPTPGAPLHHEPKERT